MRNARSIGALLCCLSLQAGAATPLSLEEIKSHVCATGTDWQRLSCRQKIDSLDRKLNVAFKEAIRATPKPGALRDAQRSWLTKVRDACDTRDCVNQSLVERIVALQVIEVDALRRLEAPMTDSEQRALCEGVAALDSNGEIEDRLFAASELPHSQAAAAEFNGSKELRDQFSFTPQTFFALRIRQDQDVYFGQVFDGGTCASYRIFSVNQPRLRAGEQWPSDEIDPEEADGALRWIGWGASESLLEYRGRYFIMTGSYPNRGMQLMEWITPAANRRPICTFALGRVEVSVTYSGSSPKLCKAVANNELSPLAASAFPLTLDADNDGKTDHLVLNGEDSGAGCGHSAAWFDVIDPATNTSRGGPLSKALRSIGKYNSRDLNIYSHEGAYYLEGDLEHAPALFALSRGALETECVFRVQPKRVVEKVYPLDGAVRDPSKANDLQP